MVTKEYIEKNIKDGWQLNPNEKVVNGILKGLNRCNGECLCSNDSYDKHCPCSNYRENNYCCCKLYIKI